jgi:hypothetical protein
LKGTSQILMLENRLNIIGLFSKQTNNLIMIHDSYKRFERWKITGVVFSYTNYPQGLFEG